MKSTYKSREMLTRELEQQKYEFEKLKAKYDKKLVKEQSETLEKNQLADILLQSVPIAVFFKDLNGKYLGCNKVFTEITGISNKRIYGKTVHDLWPKSLADIYDNHDQQIWKTNFYQEYESSVIDKHGIEHQIVLFKDIFKDSDGNIAGLIGAFVDISRLKQVEAELKKTKNLLEQINQLAKAGVWELDVENNTIYWSEVTKEMVEVPMDYQPNVDSVADFYKEGENREKILRLVNNAITKGESFDDEFEVVTQTGKVRWIRNIGKPLFENGRCVRLIGSFHNITDRKLAEKELTRQADLRQLLVSLSSSYINLPNEMVEHEINRTLQQIGEFVGADRAYIFSYDFESFTATNYYEWCNKGISSQIENLQNIPLEKYKIWLEEHKQGNTIVINNVNALPHNELRDLMEIQDVKGLLTIPLMSLENKCIGFVGFDSVKSYHMFHEADQQLLKAYAQMLVNVKLRKENEEELIKTRHKVEEIEEKHRFLFNNTIQGVVYQAENGEIIYANSAAERILGLSIDQMQGRKSIDPNWKSIHEDSSDFPGVEHPAMISLKTGKALHDIIMGVYNPARKDYTWININSFPRFKDGKKQPYEVVSTFEDITELRTKNMELNEARVKAELDRAKVSAIIENTTENIWALDRNYNIIYINERFQTEFKSSFGILLEPGKKLLTSLPEVLKPIWKERYDRALNGEQFTFEEAVNTISGKVYIQVAMNPIVADAKVIGVSCFGSNITPRKQAEQEIIKAKEKAEESDRLKSAFLANMSHEIRTPMNGILGFADLLKNPNLTGEEHTEYIRIIEKSGIRMLNIINDIIDISKIEAGLVDLKIAKSNINEQVEFLYNFFKPEMDRKGIGFKFNITLPAKEAIVETDKEKLYAVLTNLLKNAIKFTNQGKIEYGYVRRNGYLEFYVKDTGIGIPKNRQEAIFDRFVQADIEDREARQGAGLGLSISKAYVEMLGGNIWLTSEENVGTTFNFTIPYICAERTDEKNTRRDVDCSSSKKPPKKLKILVVEDDEISEKLITLTVQDFYDELYIARTGQEAIDIMKKVHEIDLILMDIQLPGIGGYEVTTRIREFNKHVIIIAQTAYGLLGDKENALASGCNDYISKPINPHQLIAKIQSYFNSK